MWGKILCRIGKCVMKILLIIYFRNKINFTIVNVLYSSMCTHIVLIYIYIYIPHTCWSNLINIVGCSSHLDLFIIKSKDRMFVTTVNGSTFTLLIFYGLSNFWNLKKSLPTFYRRIFGAYVFRTLHNVQISENSFNLCSVIDVENKEQGKVEVSR